MMITENEARDHAGHEQRADVGLAERGEEHGERRGRDDHREAAHAHDRPERKVFAVAPLHHLGNHQLAEERTGAH